MSKREPVVEESIQFGANLRHLRKTIGLTQRELGSRTGVVYSSICLYEAGKMNPTLRNMVLLCKFFNISLSRMISEDLSK